MTAMLPNDQQPWGTPPPIPRHKRMDLPLSSIAALIVGVGVLAALMGSFYTVQPTEMAGVRRLGTVVSTSPVGPGLHMKIPFIDTVDTIQTSLTSSSSPISPSIRSTTKP